MTRREEALQKIAGLIGATYSEKQLNKVACKQDADMINKVSKASSMLKVAAQEIRNLRQENEKLASENQELKNRISNINKHEEAEKLANTMVTKGMLKKADVEHKTTELMALDDEGFEIIRDAIENISVEKTASYEGESSLTFMYETEEDIPPEPPTMADAASKYIPNNKMFF